MTPHPRPPAPRRARRVARLALLAALLTLLLVQWGPGLLPRPPGTALVFAACAGSNEAVVADAIAGAVIGRCPIPGPPTGVVFDPRRTLLFVGAVDPARIFFYDLEHWELAGSVPIRPPSAALRLSQDSRLLFVSQLGKDHELTFQVDQVVSAENRETELPHEIRPRAGRILKNMRGHLAHLNPQPEDTEYVFSIQPDVKDVLVGDRKSGNAVCTIPAGESPLALNWSRDLSKLYVTVAGEDAVKVIDTRRLEVIASIPVGSSPNHFQILGDTWLGAVASQDGELTLIDTERARVVRTVPLGGRPGWIDVWPRDTRSGLL